MQYNPKTVVVIGGGLQGCETAEALGEYKFPDGSPKYKTILIELRDILLAGTSMAAHRNHDLGMEYTGDAVSARHLISHGFAYRLGNQPEDVLIPSEMNYAVSEQTEREGKITAEGQVRFMEEVVIPHFKHEFNWLADRDGLTAEERQQLLQDRYGIEDFSQLYRLLTQEEISAFNGPIGKVEPVAVATREFGFDVMARDADLIARLQDLEAKKMLQIMTGHAVNHIAIRDEKPLIYLDGGTEAIEADIVIDTTNEMILHHTSQFDPDQEVMVYYRAGLVLQYEEGDLIEMDRMTKAGETGGMVCTSKAGQLDSSPHDKRYAAVFMLNDQATYRLGQKVLTVKDAKPENIWDAAPYDSEEYINWCLDFHEKSVQRYPDLASGAPVDLIKGYACNYKSTNKYRIEERRDPKPREVQKNIFIAPRTKASHGLAGREAAYLINERADNPDADEVRLPAHTLELMPSIRAALAPRRVLPAEKRKARFEQVKSAFGYVPGMHDIDTTASMQRIQDKMRKDIDSFDLI